MFTSSCRCGSFFSQQVCIPFEMPSSILFASSMTIIVSSIEFARLFAPQSRKEGFRTFPAVYDPPPHVTACWDSQCEAHPCWSLNSSYSTGACHSRRPELETASVKYFRKSSQRKTHSSEGQNGRSLGDLLTIFSSIWSQLFIYWTADRLCLFRKALTILWHEAHHKVYIIFLRKERTDLLKWVIQNSRALDSTRWCIYSCCSSYPWEINTPHSSSRYSKPSRSASLPNCE